jgi:hypothetical protein
VPAVLASVVGEVRASDPSGQAVVARIGTVLPVGSQLCTEADSYATVRLAATGGGSHDDLYLSASSCVKVKVSMGASAGSAGRQSRVDLTAGSLSVRAGEVPGEVVIDTPSGLATGTGGGFRVHLEEQRTRLEATDAIVAVIGSGREQVVEAGFGTRVAAGRAPEKPHALLLPGTPAFPDEGTALLEPVFAWLPVERALGYQLEFSSAPDFSEIVWSEEVDGTAYTPELLFLPFRVRGLWWRVASFDRTGFLGRASEPRSLTFPAGIGP